jgi:hypothetical protein
MKELIRQVFSIPVTPASLQERIRKLEKLKTDLDDLTSYTEKLIQECREYMNTAEYCNAAGLKFALLGLYLKSFYYDFVFWNTGRRIDRKREAFFRLVNESLRILEITRQDYKRLGLSEEIALLNEAIKTINKIKNLSGNHN